MAKRIYNKNAREKALLEEAYRSVYNEGQFSRLAYDLDQAGLPKRYQVVSVGGEHSEQESVVGEFETIDEVIDFIDLPEEYGREWTVDIRDNRNWSSEGFEDGLLRFGLGEIYEIVDTGSDEYDPDVSDEVDDLEIINVDRDRDDRQGLPPY